MNPNNLCAVYARVSSDRQNPLSPTDQVRKCREFADANGFVVLEGHVYIDEGLSGVGSDRPAFQKLLSIAFSARRPFDTILVDDTSRLSRNQAEAMTLVEKLKFEGLRIIFPSQGIDTLSEQADVQMTVHGLMDSMYVKELAKKTHRGLESCALRGLHTGGRCYGYSAVSVGEGESKRLQVNQAEAVIVKEIFELSATGISLKRIAKYLNERHVSAPRSKSIHRGTWCPTAIRAMLKRQLYKGDFVWNRSKFVKVPGTNKRRSRPRPENEWKRLSVPDLAIVPAEIWSAVQLRFRSFVEAGETDRKCGLVSRAVTSPYLFSNRLKCGRCGSNLIVSSGGKKNRKYVCTGYLNRGICTNNLRIGADEVESQLLSNLQKDLWQPDRINLAVEEFGRQLRSSLGSLSGELAQMRLRKEKLEREIRNLTEAIAENGPSKHVLQGIAEREKEISGITDRLLASAPDSIETRVEDLKRLVDKGIENLGDLLKKNAPLAKQELHRHLLGVQMYPTEDGEGWCYLAEGAWDLMGNAPVGPMLGQPEDGRRFEMVAGGGFVPQSLTDSLELTDSTMVRNAKNGHKGNFFIQFSFTSFFRRSRRRSLRKGTAVEERP